MKTTYDPIAKGLHWLVFILLAIEFTIAWTMPGMRRATDVSGLVALHFSFGMLIFAVIIIRTIWRLTHKTPPLPDEMPSYMKLLANGMHYALYVILLVLPILGWAWASSRGWNVSFFGMFNFPPLLGVGSPYGQTLGELHSLLGNTLAWLIGLHILAALYHHYQLKDDVLVRMLPDALVAKVK